MSTGRFVGSNYSRFFRLDPSESQTHGA
jgi:hypothetical protein